MSELYQHFESIRTSLRKSQSTDSFLGLSEEGLPSEVELSAEQLSKLTPEQYAELQAKSFKRRTQLATVQECHRRVEVLRSSSTLPPSQRALYFRELAGFLKLHDAFLHSRGRTIEWGQIEPPPAELLREYHQLPPEPARADASRLLSKLAVLKFNGGLGTTMGCSGPKSVIEVRRGNTFLDLVVQQLEHLNNDYQAQVPLVLMNSFNTSVQTRKVVQKYSLYTVDLTMFNQSRYPRIVRDTLLPVPASADAPEECWYPPGHGDVFESLLQTGVLDDLLAKGKEYVFMSNVDNLGATVDVRILAQMEQHGHEYVMEVTDKTTADVKGGTVIKYGGKAKLLELAQVPPDHVNDFVSIKKFKIFNTNNLWVNLRAIKRVVEADVLRKMDVISNPKTMHDGTAVIQLERAAGAAMEFFDRSIAVNVPRSRFLPVKSTSDLLVVQSGIYDLARGRLTWSKSRVMPTIPTVKLGAYFQKVSDYEARFKSKPNILELEHLTVTGDVTFGKSVVLKGTVIIVASEKGSIYIPDGSILENQVVTGSLQIHAH